MANGDINSLPKAPSIGHATDTNYSTLSAIYDKIAKPDNREQLAKIFGNQKVSGINSLLRMVGASKAAGMDNEVVWWEEQRLHAGVDAPSASTAISSVSADPMTITLTGSNTFLVNDVVLVYTVADGSARPERAQVISRTSTTIVVRPYKNWVATHLADVVTGVGKVSNEFGQGTDQPTEFLASDADKYTNTYRILKTMFSVTGSQMTNIGWIKVDGSWLWYHKQEQDFRDRTNDYDELSSILSDKLTNAGLAGVAEFNQNGSEGLFSAIESRGLNYEYYLESIADLDKVIRSLDKQKGVGEYAFYVNRMQDQTWDTFMSLGNTTEANIRSGVNEQYTVFGGDKKKAINLGFASAHRSSYTFHKHDYKLLNDSQLLGATGTDYYKGVMIPMMTTVDPNLGTTSPILEINHKGVEGYSREMEHFKFGGVPMAGYSSTQDALQFEYKSEKNLVVRGANNCVLFAGGVAA